MGRVDVDGLPLRGGGRWTRPAVPDMVALVVVAGPVAQRRQELGTEGRDEQQ